MVLTGKHCAEHSKDYPLGQTLPAQFVAASSLSCNDRMNISADFNLIYQGLSMNTKLKIGQHFDDLILNCTFLEEKCSFEQMKCVALKSDCSLF